LGRGKYFLRDFIESKVCVLCTLSFLLFGVETADKMIFFAVPLEESRLFLLATLGAIFTAGRKFTPLGQAERVRHVTRDGV
jgi:hypothetical protein